MRPHRVLLHVALIAAAAYGPAQAQAWKPTPEWKAEVDRAGCVNHYMGSRELAAYFERQHASLRTVLIELGLASEEAVR